MNAKLLVALFLGVLLLGCTSGGNPTATPAPTGTATVGTTPEPTDFPPLPPEDGTATPTTQPTSTPTVQPTPTEGSMQPQVIQMTAKMFEFAPSTLTLKKGVPVKLVIRNEDVEHGFSINELNVKETLPAGQTTTVEFTPDKTGTFTFYCSVFCGAGHREMKGTVTVEE